jgi:hypothetical protein
MQVEMSVSLMWVRVDVIQAIGVEIRCSADDAMYLIASGEQELGKIRSILTRDA